MTVNEETLGTTELGRVNVKFCPTLVPINSPDVLFLYVYKVAVHVAELDVGIAPAQYDTLIVAEYVYADVLPGVI